MASIIVPICACLNFPLLQCSRFAECKLARKFPQISKKLLRFTKNLPFVKDIVKTIVAINLSVKSNYPSIFNPNTFGRSNFRTIKLSNFICPKFCLSKSFKLLAQKNALNDTLSLTNSLCKHKYYSIEKTLDANIYFIDTNNSWL